MNRILDRRNKREAWKPDNFFLNFRQNIANIQSRKKLVNILTPRNYALRMLYAALAREPASPIARNLPLLALVTANPVLTFSSNFISSSSHLKRPPKS